MAKAIRNITPAATSIQFGVSGGRWWIAGIRVMRNTGDDASIEVTLAADRPIYLNLGPVEALELAAAIVAVAAGEGNQT